MLVWSKFQCLLVWSWLVMPSYYSELIHFVVKDMEQFIQYPLKLSYSITHLAMSRWGHSSSSHSLHICPRIQRRGQLWYWGLYLHVNLQSFCELLLQPSWGEMGIYLCSETERQQTVFRMSVGAERHKVIVPVVHDALTITFLYDIQPEPAFGHGLTVSKCICWQDWELRGIILDPICWVC